MHYQTQSSLEQIEININTLVLTANQRLSLRTQQAYDKKQIQLHKTSWLTPLILPLTTWLQQSAAKQLQQIILSAPQELYLWESIIRQCCDDVELINPSDTAATAANAWQTLHLWNAPLKHLADQSNQEVALFYQWCLQFEALLKSNHWLSTAQIPSALVQHVARILNNNPIQSILLIGFDELPPAVEKLITAFDTHVQVSLLRIEKKASSIVQTTLHDQQTEMQTMAAWAKHHTDLMPHAKIGCIIPQLETLRRDLFNTFSETFSPEQLLPGALPAERKFNISAGQRMSDYPIIYCALHVIEWLYSTIDLRAIGTLLQSPYLHHDPNEQDDAARIDCMLREFKEAELPFHAIFEAAHNIPLETRLINRLREINTKLKAIPSVATLSHWSRLMSDLLDTIGWPGYRTLNSEEYQIVMRWRQLLVEYTHYTLVCADQITLSEALYLLHKQTRNTIFQSEGSQARVQILGVLEASGNDFDYMWVMGLDDDTWPAAPKPNPFIPYAMQKEWHMPHASAERELLYTEQMMHRLCHSAEHIIFSSPQFEGDKQKNTSRLLQDITYLSFSSPDSHSNEHEQIPPQPLEFIQDTFAPALTDTEVIKGGAFILQQQSDCPFKAFASLRLKATALQQPQLGIRAEERGTLVHTVLERIWRQLQSQEQLKQLSTQALDALIKQSITYAITDLRKPTDSTFRKHLLAIEEKRMQPLMQQWFAYEKERPAFYISALEAPAHITLSTLRLFLRIDRIDTLATGERIIIDYKTGTNSISSWFGERPTSLQLPLYLFSDSTYAGLTYAQLRVNECSFKGLMCSDAVKQQLPGTTSIEKYQLKWSEQIERWRANLYQLAVEFESGVASVTPTNASTSCAYCDLKPLCRVEMASC